MNQHAPAPEFAMSFTQEAVLLERHDGRDWLPLGQARFGGGNLGATLNALRVEAGGAPGQSDTVLVIPDDQILYTTLTVPVGAETGAVVARALEAMTPYQADELAFDWCPAETGDIETLRVAAVARRTLDEAEEFARAQGFFATGFVARPGDARFDGQPDFGPSRAAAHDAAIPPFSAPDLSQARITAPVIEDQPEPVVALQRAEAPIVSRITPHHLPEPEVIETVVAADNAPTGAPEPQPIPDQPSNAGPNEPEASVATAPVVAAPPVIRHGDRKPSDTPRLSPRAAAVHDRAAEARARRVATEEPALKPHQALIARLKRMDPARLPVMMGLLVAALVAVLLFFGGADDTQQIAGDAQPPTSQSSAPQPSEDQSSASQPSADPVVSDISPASEPASEIAGEPALPDSAVTDPAAAPAETTQSAMAENGPDTTSAEAQPVAPTETTEAPETAAAPPSTDDAGSDALTRALSEALDGTTRETASAQATRIADAPTSEAAAQDIDAPRAEASSAAPETSSTAPSPEAAARAAAAASTLRLSRSVRPGTAPVRAETPPAPDSRPAVPANPLPFDQRTQPEPPRVTGTRPPARPAAAARSAPRPEAAAPATSGTGAPRPAAASAPQRAPSAQPLGSSRRPPARPDSLTLLEEGSASESGTPTRLTAAEEAFLTGLLRDLRTAEAGATGLSNAEHDVLIRLADARPQRRPVSVSAPSDKAVRDAVAQAVATAERPVPRDTSAAAPPAPAPSSSVQASLRRSARPLTRPSDSGPGNPSLSSGAVDDAIAAAVANSPAPAGAVALTALKASALPPRRSAAAARAAASSLAPSTPGSAPSADDLRAAAEAQQRDAAQAEQRRMDEELQRQAEARARARAAADAQAEAQARAQAEARARAQAEAEARAAAARKQAYTPPEAEKEPEVAANVAVGRGQGSAAANATVKDGITLSRTQIIGTVGAGKASRALVRLSNGRVITLRLGDKINGGTITDIGNSRITYVKAGRPQQLSVLNGQ
ncbi:hypothetical protein MU516_05515 [Paracoccus sp. YLB-12]|uniref:Meckel syndrome type 1 protein n=1 Tax=Paracoccus maritimus TaxID=2933292 RepID=A0ABT2K729_9RHOB|nr:hypothetical protein [Paracoccus sp. YLB-12]MCT4332326.1 hypothetical protein [Paracoccus sp. YLB-12]